MAGDPPVIGEFEQMILLAVLQRKDDAYGATIYDELSRHTRRPVARGAVYMTLDRLEKKGLLKSTLSEPTPERGGRAKRCYALTRSAVQGLRASRRTLLSLWSGLELLLEK
jgi:PadR family transcriptional regulator, regulatory protein PadR